MLWRSLVSEEREEQEPKGEVPEVGGIDRVERGVGEKAVREEIPEVLPALAKQPDDVEMEFVSEDFLHLLHFKEGVQELVAVDAVVIDPLRLPAPALSEDPKEVLDLGDQEARGRREVTAEPSVETCNPGSRPTRIDHGRIADDLPPLLRRCRVLGGDLPSSGIDEPLRHAGPPEDEVLRHRVVDGLVLLRPCVEGSARPFPHHAAFRIKNRAWQKELKRRLLSALDGVAPEDVHRLRCEQCDELEQRGPEVQARHGIDRIVGSVGEVHRRPVHPLQLIHRLCLDLPQLSGDLLHPLFGSRELPQRSDAPAENVGPDHCARAAPLQPR